MGIDISVVMTLHSEGLIVHRTFKALQSNIELARKQGLTVEVVAVLDRVSDRMLQDTVEKWSSILDGIILLHKVDFGAITRSRNYGVSHSRGEFISTLDGDDLYGGQWLLRAHQVCFSDSRTIAHPEVSYSFPFETFLRYHCNGESANKELLNSNQWYSLQMAHRDIFLKFPYVEDNQYFAYQDWLWNCETAAQGFVHVLVPKTLMAIRQKPNAKSLWQNTHSLDKVVRPNILFRNFFLGKYNSNSENSVGSATNYHYQKEFKKGIRNFVSQLLVPPLDYLQFHHSDLFKQIVQFKHTVFSRFKYMAQKNIVPRWVQTELNQLSKIEPNLKNFKKPQIRRKQPSNRLNHAITPHMAPLIQERSSKVYILDGLKDDWETLSALSYLHYHDTRTFVITTKKCKNQWKQFLKNDCVHIDIGNSNLFFEEKLKLLHRLILESEAEYLHIIGSKIGLEMVNRYHGTFEKIKIFTSFFRSDFKINDDQIIWKYRHYGELLDLFTCISTDTKIVRQFLIGVYGLPEHLVQLHRMPHASKYLSEFLDADRYSRLARFDPNKSRNKIKFFHRKMQSRQQDIKIDEWISEILNTGSMSTKAYRESFEGKNVMQPIDENCSGDNFTELARQFYNRKIV